VLAEAGLALRAPPRGPRRLLRLLPAEAALLPGTPPATVATLPAETLPRAAQGQALLPRAGFGGRLHRLQSGAVSLQVLAGTIRAAEAVIPLAHLLLEGPAAAVLALATALAAELPLLPAAASPDEMARALAAGEPPRPRRRDAPDLHQAETAGAALALAIAHLTEVLLAQAPLAHAGAGPEGVHKSRVAARRLRSCLKVFRPEIEGPGWRGLDAALGQFARGLGAAREWDVFLGGLGRELRQAAGEDPRLDALIAQGGARREEAYAALRRMLEGPEFRRLIWQAVGLAGLPPTPSTTAEVAPDPDAALRPKARAVLARRHRRILKRGRHIESLPDDALHELRLDAKRLRYAAELFAPLWPGHAARRYLKRLAAVQEALGLANDSATARALVSGLRAPAAGETGPSASPVSDWAIGLAEGWALAARGDMRSAAMRPWRRFKQVDPFWMHG
jgi:CHAD domain-containing protein